MTVLIVGGDYVTSFKHLVSTQHGARVEHWSGRKKGFTKRSFPNETKLVVLVCDYVSHSLANSVKEKANRNGIPLVFCHRSVNELKHKLLNKKESDIEGCAAVFVRPEIQCRDFTNDEIYAQQTVILGYAIVKAIGAVDCSR